MADSNITKKVLAQALRELMDETPFEKINVAQICEKCGMNRKSFYYHFKDKYDLVNWIFDTEFISLMTEWQQEDDWGFIERACHYFYDNRSFYRRALTIQGQNSFSDHLHEFTYLLIKDRMQTISGHDDIHPMCINFLTDAFEAALIRWLTDKNCMPADQFIQIFRTLIEKTALEVCKQMDSIS
ncbi:MAG: TetR/AcrR family transcriptional regulator C-terminal domain-containing protein [Lachnospiraceae bacterium]|nr:TetR/AcrR family transcriptional regulator C-terminal domain-containing protein [Lachnospiraceae bacterium]